MTNRAHPAAAPERPDCVAGHRGLELANVALTRRDLNRSLPGVREKSLVRKCCVNPRSSAEITKNRHFRVRVLSPQPRSPVLHQLNGVRRIGVLKIRTRGENRMTRAKPP